MLGRLALRLTFVRMAAGPPQVDLMKSRSTQRRPSAENLSKCYTSTCQKWGAYGLSPRGGRLAACEEEFQPRTKSSTEQVKTGVKHN